MMAFALALVAMAVPRWLALVRSAGQPDVTLREDAAAMELGELAERKEMLLQLIQSTEFDHKAGKITEDARDGSLRRLKREAVNVMKRMDEIGGTDDDLQAADALLEAQRASSLALDASAREAAETSASDLTPAEAVS